MLRLGVLGEKQSREKSDGTKATDTLQFTYRAYLALGFGFVQTAESHDLRDAIIRRIDGMSAQDITDLRAAFNAGNADDDPVAQTLVFLSQAQPNLFELPHDQLLALLRSKVSTYTDLRKQPTFNFEARAEGSYNPLDYDVRRYNSLYTLAVNVWLNPRRPEDGKLTLGYQNGYSRGALTQSLDGFIATVGFKF